MKRKEKTNATMAKITDHMKERGLKYTWLCGKIGISNSHFTNIKKGSKRLTPEINDRINKALGTSFKL
jgi:plasmid maintenance system antidote protein VapI